MALSPEELEFRRGFITATDVPKILGLSSWGGPMDVFQPKVFGDSKSASTVDTQWGDRLEPVIVDWYREQFPSRDVLYPCKFQISEEIAWAGCTPDAIVDGEMVLEVKTAHWRKAKEWGPSGTNLIPDEYYVQVMWQMLVLGFPCADVAALVDRDFRLYEIKRDQELIDLILSKVEPFWTENIRKKIPPTWDGSQAGFEVQAKLFMEGDKEILAPSVDIDKYTKRWEELSRQEREIKQEISQIKQAVGVYVGSHRGIETSSGPVYWIRPKAHAVTDWEAVAKACEPSQDLVQKHTHTYHKRPYVQLYKTRESQ